MFITTGCHSCAELMVICIDAIFLTPIAHLLKGAVLMVFTAKHLSIAVTYLIGILTGIDTIFTTPTCTKDLDWRNQTSSHDIVEDGTNVVLDI